MFGYVLAYASLRSIRGQIIADFITEHQINDMHNIDTSLISLVLWRLCFDGSIRRMAKVLVLFIYLLMVLFLKPHAA